jgi:hypothetical protein
MHGPRGLIVFLVASAMACATPRGSVPAKRPIDSEPRRSKMKEPLPAGRAEAFFALNTGADQGGSEKEAGLEAVVRFADIELRQTIASCIAPSLGSALGGGTDEFLEVAYCGAEFWLETRNGVVLVTRQTAEAKSAVVSRFLLPAGVARASRPPG